MRTLTTSVTFRQPFLLPGFEAAHDPGTFEVKTDEERLDTTWEAWRRVATSILLVDGGRTWAWPVDPSALQLALTRDRAAPAAASGSGQ